MAKPTLQSKAYQMILDKIISGEFQPGAEMREAPLAQALGISVTPIREALRRLEREGWLETFPYRGCFMRRISREELIQLSLMRESLEVVCVEQFCRNGTEQDIELVEELPADEETIARFGPRASNGVILITLRYDEPARFEADSLSFGNYIARRVRWEAHEPAARVVLRYRITAEGQTIVEDELESTDNRLKRRVLKAVEEAPCWRPARKNGRAVESEGVLRIQLPEGKRMPRQIELVIR